MRILIQKFRVMILLSILFFYLGCVLTMSFLQVDCASATTANKISDTAELNKVDYVVLILSGPDNEVKRDAIRATWANFVNNIIIENGERIYKWNHSWTEPKPKNDFTKLFYVISTKGLTGEQLNNLNIEQKRAKDLLFLDNLQDSYESLASKMLYSIKWIHDNYRGLKYVIKCDDDSFVRVDLIIKDLEAFAPAMNAPEINVHLTRKKDLLEYKGLYWGYFDGRARVYLNGKWEEKDWFMCDMYLPYALGGGYVISRSIVEYVARNYDVLSLYQSEDVSMGVWTAALDRINRVHDIRFDTEWKSRGCDTTMLVRHKQTPSDMFEMYRTLVYSHGKKLCKTETKLRKSYFYDWNVLPSMCCKR